MKSKVIIIGGGPVGLYLASKLDNFLLFEATDKLGGQIPNLYPEKLITDIPEYPSLKAKEYIEILSKKVDHSKIHLNEKVLDVVDGENPKIITSKGEYDCDYLLIATGLGFSSPRPLGVEHEKECENILYHLKDFSFLKDKKVAIFGGGDSALDWAKEISSISNNVSLIHRRTEFRGNPETIKDCKNLKLYLPYVPYSLEKDDNKCSKIIIKKVSETEQELVSLDVDYVLVNYGNIAETPNFNFAKEGAFFKVDNDYKVSSCIFVVGDASIHENKKRRIAPGNAEADHVLKLIK